MKVMNDTKTFKRAVIFSVAAHLALFLLILVSPSLPKSSRKGMIHYIPLNFVTFPGGEGGGGSGGGSGGGGGGGGEKKGDVLAETKKETLRDLTTLQKLQEEPKSTLRHPVEKPKKEREAKKDKKATISKPQQSIQDTAQTKGEKAGSTAGTSGGMGSGLRIGIGGGSGSGGGTGSGYSSQIGLSNFPFTYYLQIIMDRVSANWFTSLVDPGVLGNFEAVIYFKIYKNGQISDLKVEQSSGIKSLDLSALRAVQSSAPFPPLPKDYEDEYLGIRLIFEHSK